MEAGTRLSVQVISGFVDFKRHVPLLTFAVGSALYLASWVPALKGLPLGRRRVVYFSPYVTPLIWLLAIAWMGRSWPFAVASFLFVAVHAAHGMAAYRCIGASE